MQNPERKVVNKIIDNSIIFITLMSIPFNWIIYFALIHSEYQFPRIIPPLLGLTVFVLYLFRNKITLNLKTWSFISILFLTGCFNLLLGLIDLASLWFILAIIYSLFISKKNEALFVFLCSFVIVLAVGIFMMTRISFIPLNYKFDICQFACVAIRILHFILIASLIYYILKVFFSTIQNNLVNLELKSEDLENLNIALKSEMAERKAVQQKMMDAIILTEEKERKRIASDLHDDLGPVLSAVNLFFQAYIDSEDNKSRKEIEHKLKEIIGNSIKEVSRISHNISPHILENYGLITALENFINQIRASEKVQFNHDFCEMNRLNIKEELVIYRAVTELINNSLKHSGASVISIKSIKEGKLFHVYYEDNGKGFNIDQELSSQTGMGLNNIQTSEYGHRVARVVSLGTPHLGSNMSGGALSALLNGADEKSEACRDLRYSQTPSKTPYLFGGNETSFLWNPAPYNKDINCNGSSTDIITSLNTGTTYNSSMPLPTNIYYTWVTSNYLGLNQDGLVELSRQWLYNSSTAAPQTADTLLLKINHIAEPNDIQAIIRGIDEPPETNYAYQLQMDQLTRGYITYGMNWNNRDVDAFSITPPQNGKLEITFTNVNSGTDSILFYDGTNLRLNSIITSGMQTFTVDNLVQGKTYNILVKGTATSSSWKNPYTINCKISSSAYTISGIISYANDANSPIANAKINLVNNNRIIDSVITGTQGNYSFNNVQDGTYNILAYPQGTWGGVNSTDALQIRRYLISLTTFDSLRIKASDVNGSSAINSTDALLIRKRVAGEIASFTIGDWVCENPTVLVSGASVNINIRALCTGDVNASFTPSKMEIKVEKQNEKSKPGKK